MFRVEQATHKRFREAEDAVSQRNYLAISVIAALCGVLLLLGSPVMGVDAAGYVQPMTMGGSTDAGPWSARTSDLETARMIGGLLLGSGLLGLVRVSRSAGGVGVRNGGA